jgi:hypothetical protein
VTLRGSVRALVDGIEKALPDSHVWDEREQALLSLAARQADDIDRLERDIAENGVRVEGRGGQHTLNQAFGEARQARVALARILGQVELPESVRPSVLHGRRAAQARWGDREATV